MKSTFMTWAPAVALIGLCAVAPAQAGGPYASIGLPGVTLGYAHPIGPSFVARADISTRGTHSDNRTEEGIDYDGTFTTHRAGLFGDWFFAGGWRLTGGVTFNDFKIDMNGRGNGGTINIGGTTYVTSPDDRFNVQIKFPSTTPYLGVGWGHQPAAGGWGFVFDLGGSIGRAKVSGSVSGPTLSGNVSQDDIDRELAELREGVGKIRFLPQLSIGAAYRF